MYRADRTPPQRTRLRPLVRGAAFAALGAAAVVPLVRRQLKIPPAATAAVVASGPPALAVLSRRTPARDLALYFLQGWAFIVSHELPYDDPEALRKRVKIQYPIRIDKVIGRGKLPNTRLQEALSGLGRGNALDKALSWAHWAWFFWPHGALIWIMARRPDAFARAARQTAAVYDLGCIGYAVVPTAPPWWASQEGHTPDRVRRIMVEVGEDTWGPAWERLYGTFDGNPWAAMPSLHFASALMAAILLSETGKVDGAIGWTYALTLGFALVYLGEHYVTDLIAGAALVAAVRFLDPRFEPVAELVSSRLRTLEDIANA